MRNYIKELEVYAGLHMTEIYIGNGSQPYERITVKGKEVELNGKRGRWKNETK